jgi:hypothetical protein
MEDYSHIAFECKAIPHNFCGYKQATHQTVLKVLWFSVCIISPMLHTLIEQTHQLPQQQHTRYQSSSTSQSYIYHPDWYHQVTGSCSTKNTHSQNKHISCSTKDTLSPHTDKNKNTTQFQLKLNVHDKNGISASQTLESTSI